MRKIFLITFLVFLFFLLAPGQVQAGPTCTTCGLPADNPGTPNIDESKPCGGFVPCGRSCDDQSTAKDESALCQLCDIFVLSNNILIFLLIPNGPINNNLPLIPTIAALMFIIGGFYLVIAGASPELFGKAKSILTATVIGLVIVFVAWVFLNTFFMYIGVAKWTRLVPESGVIETGEGDIAGPNFLTDIEKNWQTDEFKDFPVLITGGLGAGQPEKTIISNANNTINISGAWSPSPGGGSKYNIGGNWFNFKCEITPP